MPLGGGRERFVLATLLLNAGGLTTADALIDALWDEPPRSAKAQLHNLVSNVRRRLRDGDEGLIVSHRSGYELHLDPHELDLLEFRRLAAQGRQAAADGDHAQALSTLATALSLWRGPALADLADELVDGLRPALHEERFAAADAKLTAALAVGRYDEVLRELPALIAEHPYRECLHEKHMLALVGAGRSADALAGYRYLHRKFVEELGVEPGTVLRELERRILRGEVDPVPRPAAPVVTLRQLPPPIATLTGRDDLLAEITRVLGGEHDEPSPVGVLVGPGGIGKTTLALAVAHGVTDGFPDGQLYADMRGNQERPADPHAVVGRFLRALGVDGSQVPEDPDERVSLYRSQLAGKRVLVVLDDVATEEQVRRLVPGTAGCRVLVTSRRQLGALVGAARWTVPVLDTASAVRLLTRIVGPERVAAEPSAATEIVGLCARLPLAVGIASARLAVHTHWTLAEFQQRLAEERGRLDELSVGDLDVRASIALSYQGLDPLSRTLFRMLGLIETADWPAWVAGALLGEPDERGARVLDHLVDAHLAQPVGRDAVGQGRFRLHDLVGDYARERALAEDTPADRAAAQSRVLSGWLALATESDERIPHDLVRAPADQTARPPASVAHLVRQTPIDWLEAERRNLTAAVGEACRLGLPDLAACLVLRLSGFFGLRSHHDDWEGIIRQSITCARERGSPRLLVRLLSVLFVVQLRQDRYTSLPAIAAEELAMARRLGERELEVRALRQAGLAAERLGRFAEAVTWLEQAVSAARHPDIAGSLLRATLDSLAYTHVGSGHPGRAVPLLEEALAIDASRSPRTNLLLYHYGMALTDLGRLSDAETALDKALRTTRELGDDLGAAYLEHTLAGVHIRRGRWSQAAVRLDRAVHEHRRIGNIDGLAVTLRSTGDLAAAEGRWADATTWLCRSLEVWRSIGPCIEIARTLARLERAHRITGDRAAAAACSAEYRTILADLNLDEGRLYLPPLSPSAAAG